MSGLIHNTDAILIKDTKTPALTTKSDSSSDINITLNKNQEIPKPDKETEAKIKGMVMLLNPGIDWDLLSDVEKQSYIVQYHEGTLDKKVKELEPKIAEFKASLKSMTPENATKELVNKVMEARDPKFKTLTPEEKQKRLSDAGLKLLKKMQPELDVDNMTEREKKAQLKIGEFKLQTALYAYQTGKINSLEDFKDYTPEQIKDLEYEFATVAQKANPDFVEKNFSAKKALAQVGLEKSIAAANGIELEDYRKSDEKYAMMYEYLKNKPEKELNKYEKRQLDTLKKLAYIYDDDLKCMNLHNEGSLTDSYLHKIAEGENVNWDTPAQQKILEQKMSAELKECKTPEEKQARIAVILSSARSLDEGLVLTQAFARLEKTGVVSADDLFAATEQIKMTPHALAACSTDMSCDGQVCTAKHVAASCTGEHPKMSAKQTAAYTKNVIPQYEVEAQAPSMKTVTDTGIQEVYDVLPETYAKLDEKAAKESYEYVMTSQNISAEQKAIIAKDTIDSTNNADLKKFYQDLAYKYDVDYNSVPPKSERTKTPAQTETNKTSDNIENSKYSQTEFNNILAQTMDKSTGISAIIEAILETGNTILGKTSDPKTASITKITSVDSAIDMLKSGTSFAKVFNRCSEDVKKSFIKGIMQSPQKDTAIKYLLEKGVGFDTLLKCAPTENAKKSMYNIATGVHISTVKTEVEKFAAKV